MNGIYTPDEWNKEMHLGIFCNRHAPFGSCNLECPTCHEVGFYGPREIKNEDRKYRACKWCGFWQEAAGKVFDHRGGEPYRGIIISHKNCGAGKSWYTADANQWCEKCKDFMVNEGTHKDDPLFQQIKIDMDRIHQDIPRISTR